MTQRYGKRKLSKMRAEWDALRKEVAMSGHIGLQEAFDSCESWVDFAFENASDNKE